MEEVTTGVKSFTDSCSSVCLCYVFLRNIRNIPFEVYYRYKYIRVSVYVFFSVIIGDWGGGVYQLYECVCSRIVGDNERE